MLQFYHFLQSSQHFYHASCLDIWYINAEEAWQTSTRPSNHQQIVNINDFED